MAKRLLKLTSPMMKGDDVKEFQTLVNAKGYSPGKIDGIYGNDSVAACKAFQKASGLSVDGMCGDKTWAALQGRRTLKKTSPLMSGDDVKAFQTKVKEKGFDAKKAQFPFAANGRAISMGETDGFIRLVFEKETV